MPPIPAVGDAIRLHAGVASVKEGAPPNRKECLGAVAYITRRVIVEGDDAGFGVSVRGCKSQVPVRQTAQNQLAISSAQLGRGFIAAGRNADYFTADSPWTPWRAIERATNPDALTSSTNVSRYAAAALRSRGVPRP